MIQNPKNYKKICFFKISPRMKKLWNWNQRKELKRISLPTIQRKIKETFIKVKALSYQATVYNLYNL